MVPAQAALQAHLDATSRQEAARVQTALSHLYGAYTGTNAAKDATNSADFCTIVRNPLTEQERQLHATQIMSAGMLIPPKPPQISQGDWDQALVENAGNSRSGMPQQQQQDTLPTALVGAPALQARLAYHQEWSQRLEGQLEQLLKAQAVLRKGCENLKEHVKYDQRRQKGLDSRMLQILRKVELVRGLHQPLQPDETAAQEELYNLWRQIEQLEHEQQQQQQQKVSGTHTAPVAIVEGSMPDEERLFEVLSQHRQRLTQVTMKLQGDLRDLTLIRRRLQATNRPGPKNSSGAKRPPLTA